MHQMETIAHKNKIYGNTNGMKLLTHYSLNEVAKFNTLSLKKANLSLKSLQIVSQ